MTNSDGVFHVRLKWVWGHPELEITTSARGMVPDCFHPETDLAYALEGLPEDHASHVLLRASIEAYPILAHAIATYGVPDLLKMEDLKPLSAEASPKLGGPDGIVN